MSAFLRRLVCLARTGHTWHTVFADDEFRMVARIPIDVCLGCTAVRRNLEMVQVSA